MFPQGPPGIALALLRVSVALTALLHVYLRQEVLAPWLLAALLLSGLMLVVGFLTPIFALLAMTAQFIGSLELNLPSIVELAVLSFSALALALLGPGAYSLDALRFGRRVVDLSSAEDE